MAALVLPTALFCMAASRSLAAASKRPQKTDQRGDARNSGCAGANGPHRDESFLTSAEKQTTNQCAVQTMQGSKERTMCCTATLAAPSSPTSRPCNANSSGPGRPAAHRGEKFQVVGAMI